MGVNRLAGPSSYHKTAADLAVQFDAPQLYNNANQFPSISPNLFGALTNSEKNSMLASTLAAFSVSTSESLSPDSALASVFGQELLGNLGGMNFSSSALHSTKEKSPNVLSITDINSISSRDESQHNSDPIEQPGRKPKGGKGLEDIIKRIRDKKNN